MPPGRIIMAYFIGTQEVTEEYWRAHNAAATSGLIGSQIWMNSGYTGPEPDLATKAKLSDAQYASDWISTYTQGLVNAGVPVQPAITAIANNPVQQSSIDVWNAIPQISPASALEQRIAEAGGYTQWAANMGVVTAQPTQPNNPTATLAPPSPVSGAGAGTIDPIQAIVTQIPGAGAGSGWAGGSTDGSTGSGTGLLSQIGILPILAIAGVFIILAYLATKTSRGRGVSA